MLTNIALAVIVVSYIRERVRLLKKHSEKVPLGRKAEVNEMSGTIVYLASGESSCVTGQNLTIDGGWTAW